MPTHRSCSQLQQAVLDLVYAIPKGRVTTYGALGRAVGSAQSARLIGWILRHAPKDAPAHRVVNAQGLLTGKHSFGDAHAMARMLTREGVAVHQDQVQHMATYFWDPCSNT